MKKVLSFILALMLVLSAIPMAVLAEGEVTGKIQGATLNIGSSLTLDYYATFENADAKDVSMRFTSSSGRITTVNGEYDSAQKMYKFSYTGINPQCMTDVIDAELIYNDTVIAEKNDYSVKTYSENLAQKTAAELKYTSAQAEAFRTLLADMLTYGSESQKYRDYNTATLADTSTWVSVYKSNFATPAGVRKVEGNSDANNKVKSLGLNMANVNKVYFKLVLTDDVVITLNDKTVDKNSLTKNTDGTYTLYTEDIKATGFDTVYTLKLTKAGNVISTVQYNVNAYIASKYNDATVGDIVKALHNYGASAEKYVQAMKAQTEGGDFDLGEEDDLTAEKSENLIPLKASTFEGATSASNAGWSNLGNPTLTIESDEIHGNYLKNVPKENYSTPLYDISPYIKEAGEYIISFDYMVEGSNEMQSPFSGVIRTSDKTSFAQTVNGTQIYYGTGKADIIENGEWYTFTTTVKVLEEDLGVGAPWRLGIHSIETHALEDGSKQFLSAVCMDNVTVVKKEEPKQQLVTKAETWVAEEIVLISNKTYADPFNDVDIDLILTNGTVTYTVPGFWDGGNVWKVRFVCPTEGAWTYTIKCNDTTNTGLHNISGAIKCTAYSGDLDIYKHGFVRTETGKTYFVYDDGTPFFYLGDTHWGLGSESSYMVKNIATLRAEQGYTVYQSQPIGAGFNLVNGFSEVDIAGFQVYDKKFQIVADVGLVHTNSQFIFPSSMSSLIANNGGYSDKAVTAKKGDKEYTLYEISDEVDTYLKKLSRYWVARYSAYPVMWTLGQEVDRDFFWTQTYDFHSHSDWGYANNPYVNIANYLYEYDPYKHPLSAHQEGSTYTDSSNSTFKNVTAHTWWATQWKPNVTNETLHTKAKTFAENSQGKPLINYEPYYVWLQTKNFGGRAQGWMSFLSGFAGHAYGAQDTWAFTNNYQEGETKSYDGVDTNTSEEKTNAKWTDAKKYDASFQLTYMKKFLTGTVGQWYSLIPRYNDTKYLVRDEGALAVIASTADHRKIVIYFYNFDNTEDLIVAEKPNAAGYGTATGTLKKLSAETKYNYMWFNPITGVKSYGSFTSTADGTWDIPEKANQDMVLYVYNR